MSLGKSKGVEGSSRVGIAGGGNVNSVQRGRKESSGFPLSLWDEIQNFKVTVNFLAVGMKSEQKLSGTEVM